MAATTFTPAVDLAYRHEIAEEHAPSTLCGIRSEDVPDTVDLPIACHCGHPACQLPVTCPVYLSVMSQKRVAS